MKTPLLALGLLSPRFFLGCALAGATVLALSPLRADQDTMTPKKILFFSKSSGFVHSVIWDPPAGFVAKPGSEIPGLAMQVLKELGSKNAIEFVFSKDGSLFSPGYLAQFDAICFFTSGDLTKPGTDGNPPMTQAGKAALLEAIRSGKGFVGIHAASDSFHSPGNADHGPARFQGDGDKADDYIKMLGAEFVQHGKQQQAHPIVVDPKFPGISAVPADARFTEEWYTLKNFSPDIHVLLVQDTSGMTGFEYARPNYPTTWAHLYGKGRVFYTALGHRDDIWQGAMFQTLLAGGLNWALRRVDADLTPNLEQAAPQANVMAKYVAPPKP